jgi:hypothetical protein
MIKPFYPQINDDFRNILDPLLTWKQSRYTKRFYRYYPDIEKVKGKFMGLAEKVKKEVVDNELYLNGLFEGTKTKDEVITQIVLNQTKLRNNTFDSNGMNEINQMAIDLLKGIKKGIETLPESNFKKPQKSKLNEPPKGYDLGIDTQLESIYNALIDKFLDKNTKLGHFKNAFNGEPLIDFVKLKWRKQYYASIVIRHCVEHDTPWQNAVQVFDNGTVSSLKNAYKPDDPLLSKNQRNAKLLLDKIFKSLP